MDHSTLRGLAVLLATCSLAAAYATERGPRKEWRQQGTTLKFAKVAQGGTITLMMPEHYIVDPKADTSGDTDGAVSIDVFIPGPKTLTIQTTAGDRPMDVAVSVAKKLKQTSTAPWMIFVDPDNTVIIGDFRPGYIGIKSTDPAYQGPRPVENATYKHTADGKTILTWTVPEGEKYDNVWVSFRNHYASSVPLEQNHFELVREDRNYTHEREYRIIAERDGLPSDVVVVTVKGQAKGENEK